MSDPEIDRRCTVCGASVRPRAAFCPQCGQSIPGQSEGPETHPERDDPKTIASKQSDTVAIAPEAVPDFLETQPLSAFPVRPVETAPPSQPIIVKKDLPVPDGSVRGRVEKLRKVSSVVIDQAAYDPSLRFILVAAGFFLLFLFLLLMSKVLG